MRGKKLLLVLVVVVGILVIAYDIFKSWQHRERAQELWYYSPQIATIVLFGARDAAGCSAVISPYRIKAKPGHIIVWEILDDCRKGGVAMGNFKRDGMVVNEADLFELLHGTERTIIRKVKDQGQTLYLYDVTVEGRRVATAEFEYCPEWPCDKFSKADHSATAAR